MNPPPEYLDEARVLKWAWSGKRPFGYLPYSDNHDNLPPIEVYGLAICKYEGESGVYRFSCDKDWEVVQDGVYDSIEKAIELIPNQYKEVVADWNSNTQNTP